MQEITLLWVVWLSFFLLIAIKRRMKVFKGAEKQTRPSCFSKSYYRKVCDWNCVNINLFGMPFLVSHKISWIVFAFSQIHVSQWMIISQRLVHFYKMISNWKQNLHTKFVFKLKLFYLAFFENNDMVFHHLWTIFEVIWVNQFSFIIKAHNEYITTKLVLRKVIQSSSSLLLIS